ncbi:hypothetical protein [Massilia orientalis]|uniref:Uncharacterized protein n=1 Tax=Massilia orientalis TaxID=3050128 RepID=A0ACC7MDI1_9BURK|nr:hypothetical protein [Massilia sp. YIM B02787]
MKRSTFILGLSALVGAPIWLFPDARLTLGSNAFFGLVALCIAGGLVGLATWFQDRE